MDPIWMVVIDGTSDGYYENCATACLFKSYDDARAYVERDFIDDVQSVADHELNQEETEEMIADTCTWHDEFHAQFAVRDVRTDYRIEKVPDPR